MVEDRLGRHFDYYLGKTEVVIYSVLAVLLAVTALVTIATAGEILWKGLTRWTVAAQTLRVLNELLIVLMPMEILHTVRISIRSHVLVTEPFLVVGLIASIRRISGDYSGSGHPHQRRYMDHRRRERHFSIFDD
jgi:cytochrome b subunit of formate dehydrogenase